MTMLGLIDAFSEGSVAAFAALWTLVAPPLTPPNISVRQTIEVYGDIELELMYAIAAAESSFNPEAVSNKNAHGLFQLTPIAHKDVLERTKLYIRKAQLGSLTEGEAVALYNCRDVERIAPTFQYVKDSMKANTIVASCFLSQLRVLYSYDDEKVLAHYVGGGRAVRAVEAGSESSEVRSYITRVESFKQIAIDAAMKAEPK